MLLKNKSLFVALSLTIALLPINRNNADDCMMSQDDIFGLSDLTYSVTPDDEEWAALSVTEKRDVCNFPKEQLTSLNTDQLL
ncbi:MAG: hypothetical protein J5825_04795 [Lachnospiraceae bacterium]|nr:hypothetical protein [Lachnospiraceae bacterium]